MPLIGAAQALDTANREEIGLYGVDAEPGALDLIADPNSAYQFTVGQPTDAIAVRSAENIARFLGGEEDKVRKTTYVDPIFIDKENVAKVRADLGI